MPKANQIEARANLNKPQAELMGAEQRLRNLGYTDEDLRRIVDEQDTSTTLDVVSPIAGTVVEVNAVVGEARRADRRVVRGHRPDGLWAWIDVPEPDFAKVEPRGTRSPSSSRASRALGRPATSSGSTRP